MTHEAPIHELRADLREIKAILAERCVERKVDIDENSHDINRAFSRIRDLEHKVIRISVISSLGTSVLTAALVRMIVG